MRERSTLVNYNVTILGRRTSIKLEPAMLKMLREVAAHENCTIHDLCSLIQQSKNSNSTLTAAIRVFLALYYRAAATADGHRRAGHGDFTRMIARARIPAQSRALAGVGQHPPTTITIPSPERSEPAPAL